MPEFTDSLDNMRTAAAGSGLADFETAWKWGEKVTCQLPIGDSRELVCEKLAEALYAISQDRKDQDAVSQHRAKALAIIDLIQAYRGNGELATEGQKPCTM